MGIIKAIIEKFKLKELIAIVFIVALIITIIPKRLAVVLNILQFRDTYQTYISLCLIVTDAYLILYVLNMIKSYFWSRFFGWSRIAIKYMKRYMSPDEMSLLVQTFYDRENNQFRTTGYIEYSDGRKAALESRHVIYLASQMSQWYSFAYNLQPVAREFLNRNLAQGNIIVSSERIQYKLK